MFTDKLLETTGRIIGRSHRLNELAENLLTQLVPQDTALAEYCWCTTNGCDCDIERLECQFTGQRPCGTC